MIIVPAQISDCETIAQLVRAAWANTIDIRSSGHRVTADDVLSIFEGGGGGFLAMAGEKAVGCVCYYPETSTLDLMKLAVLPETRGQGLALKMVQAVEDYAVHNGFERMLLAVSLYNLEVIPFYQRLGYVLDDKAVYNHASASSLAPKVMTKPVGFEVSTEKTRLDFEVIHGYLTQSYWSPGIPFDVVKKAAQNSLAFGVYSKEGQQVGYARVITDYATFGYLADVFILPEYRGLGLSKFLMQNIMQHTELQSLRRFLLFTKDAHGLYAQYGFTALEEPARAMHKLHKNPYKENT